MTLLVYANDTFPDTICPACRGQVYAYRNIHPLLLNSRVSPYHSLAYAHTSPLVEASEEPMHV